MSRSGSASLQQLRLLSSERCFFSLFPVPFLGGLLAAVRADYTWLPQGVPARQRHYPWLPQGVPARQRHYLRAYSLPSMARSPVSLPDGTRSRIFYVVPCDYQRRSTASSPAGTDRLRSRVPSWTLSCRCWEIRNSPIRRADEDGRDVLELLKDLSRGSSWRGGAPERGPTLRP